MGNEPTGCLLSAQEVGAAVTPMAAPEEPTATMAAIAAMNFCMGAKFNFQACLTPILAAWLPPWPLPR